MIKRFIHFGHRNNHGQSFVELALVLLILLFMMTGVVEFGMLLNNYLHVLDGTREGARLGSQMVAFDPETQASDEVFYVLTASKTLNVVHPDLNSPVELVGNRGDDLVISVFSVAGATPIRFPQGLTNGWSLCRHYQEIMGNLDLKAKMKLFFPPPSDPSDPSTDLFIKFQNNWNLCTPTGNYKSSNISSTEVSSRMVSNAFNSGAVLVEAYYNYPQMLKLPLFEQMGDPIPVYTYSMMPMGSAMPTPVVPPGP